MNICIWRIGDIEPTGEMGHERECIITDFPVEIIKTMLYDKYCCEKDK